MNEDDAKDAAWDRLMSDMIGVWFEHLSDHDAAMVRGVFDFAWSSSRMNSAKEADKIIDSATLINKEV